MSQPPTLRLYGLQPRGTRALGPGLRYTLWTQGCPRRCPGCATPGSQPLEGGAERSVEALAEDILARPYIEGITLSGGEPMLQAEALAELLRRVRRKRPEINTLLFTGYLLEELTAPPQQELLAELDLLIDGPYVEALNDDRGLRGSTNQRLHFLTPRLLSHKEELEQGPRRLEMTVLDGRVETIGITGKLFTRN